MNALRITGHTWPVRTQLKAFGCKWDPNQKVWIAPDEKTRKVCQDLVPEEETRDCWECGRSFTYRECRRQDGDWQDSYCGC